jgi:hypothetical protein
MTSAHVGTVWAGRQMDIIKLSPQALIEHWAIPMLVSMLPTQQVGTAHGETLNSKI